MLSLIGIPPLAGFFGKLYVFMEALNQTHESQRVTLIWLVALGLFNSVVSAFYYVRVLKAMFLREAGARALASPDRGIALPIVIGTIVVTLFGLMPDSLIGVMQAAAVPMLTSPVKLVRSDRMAAMEQAVPNAAPRPVHVEVAIPTARPKGAVNGNRNTNKPASTVPVEKQAAPTEKKAN
jgi:NADH-quinone oxidoreductase subunit N